MNSSPHVQSPLMNAPHEHVPQRSWIWMAVSIAVGLLFIYAGILKTLDPIHFASDIQNYKILSYPLAVRLALYLPWLEVLCGVAMIAGWLRSGALAILTGLMLLFIVVTLAAKARGINLDCGCFGVASKGWSFSAHLLTDFAILAALALLWFRPSRTAR